MRPGHPCRCDQEVGRPGARECRAVGHGGPPDPLAGRRCRQVRRARSAARASAMTGSSSIRPSSGAARRAKPGGSRKACPAWSPIAAQLLDAESRFLFLTVYAVRMSSLALGGLLAEHFADLPGTIEHGDLAVREEGEGGRLLPTAIFARWRRARSARRSGSRSLPRRSAQPHPLDIVATGPASLTLVDGASASARHGWGRRFRRSPSGTALSRNALHRLRSPWLPVYLLGSSPAAISRLRASATAARHGPGLLARPCRW